MRIRKLIGRGRPPASRPSVPAAKSNGPVKPQQTQPLLPRPTAASPLHPNSFYHALGLYKYGTGVLPLSAAMQQRVKAGKVSLKVYSTEPASHKDVRAALSSALRSSRYAVNLRSSLAQLYEITAAVLSSSNLIENAYLQIFERFSRRFDARRTATRARNRQWSLSLEVSRAASGLTRPLLQLEFGSIYPSRRCKIRDSHLIGKLDLALLFHLKSPVPDSGVLVQPLSNNVKDEDPAGPIQPLVNDITEQVLQSTRGSNFVDENSMLYKIERAVLEYVTSSPLAVFVDLYVLHLTYATEPSRERFVLSRLLNADGSIKESGKDLKDRTEMYSSMSARLQARKSPGSGDSIALPSPFSADTSSQDIKKLAGLDPRLALQGSFSPSDACRKKTGIQRFLRIFVDRKKDHALQNSQMSPSEILSVFDSLCANALSSSGLTCLAYATALMASQFSDLSACLESGQMSIPMPHNSPLLSQDIELSFFANYGHDYFRLRLPSVTNLDFSIHQSIVRSKICQVYLTGRYQKDAAKHHAEYLEHKLPEELKAVTEMLLIVTEGIAKGVDFESSEIIPLRLAEGLLRTVQFLSPSIVLEGVRVRLAFPDESFDGRSEVSAEKWREPHVDNFLSGAKTSGETSVVDHETAHTAPGSEQGISGSSKETLESQTGTEWEWNEAHVDKKDWTNAAKQDYEAYEAEFEIDATPSEVQKSRGLARHSYLEAKGLELSSNLQRKIGFNIGQFRIRWKYTDRTSTLRLNSEDVRSLFTNALEKPSTGDLQSVSSALQSVVETLPNDTELTFCLKSLTPESFGPFFFPGSYIAVFFYNEGLEARTTEGNQNQISISAPVIRDLPVQVEQPSISAKMLLSLSIHFDGRPPQDNRASLDKGSMSQVRYIMEICVEKAKHTLSSNKFGDLNELTDRLAALIIDQSDLFKDILNVRKVRIKTRMFAQDHGSPRLLASAQASSLRNTIFGTNRNSITTYEDQSRAVDRIFIALGSNLGDRLHNIERACREMSKMPNTKILKTSALYETAPMYVKDQDSFLNGVCEIETTLSPYKLLEELQAIEQRMGRVKQIDKGPRNIDLDILLYRTERIQTDRLTIPHPLMLEREFVLRPLCDIPTANRRRHPTAYKPNQELLASLTLESDHTGETMYPLTELASGASYIHLGRSGEPTRIMSILNLTPDSFSDGGVHSPTDLEQLRISIRSQIANGATIVDIGGQSSRPNAPDVTTEEELSRILPAIEAIKSIPEAANVAISVDTYRAAVAEAAINAGAHIINDISAGLLDAEMLPTVAKLGCTYIMMHMRGTPSTMMSEDNCAYPSGLIYTVADELFERTQAAQAAGIRRWRIILDPGIGFSKTTEQNLDILHNFGKLKKNGSLGAFPWLIGSSRKSFIGKITGVEDPKERGWGTAATVTAAIQGGADIVRVHDAAEMSAVVKMADAIHRSRA